MITVHFFMTRGGYSKNFLQITCHILMKFLQASHERLIIKQVAWNKLSLLLMMQK